jgi:chromosomal replication initiator protein
MNGKQIWQAALGELQIQMSRPDYATWLKDTCLISHEDGVFVIGVSTPFAKEWLENRLSSPIRQTLTGILGYSVETRFIVYQRPAEPHRQTEARGALVPLSDTRRGTVAPAMDGAVSSATARPATVVRAHPQPAPEPSLNPRYTFDNYVVGDSNRMAHAACLAVAQSPAKAYNPLFLYGGVGLGKTHLLHAIGNAAISKGQYVLYVSSEKFTNDMINSIREQRTEAFRNKYRSLDVLLVDDIQFLAGKEGTQEEFFHTFNTLHEAGRQIVVSSDRPPKAILAMEGRLRSRLEWGLIADVQAPDLETRVAILQAKALTAQTPVPAAVLDFIAQHVQTNIRELEGSLNRVVAYASFKQAPMTAALAAEALGDIVFNHQKAVPSRVVAAVCQHYNMEPDALRGKQRDKEIVLPRQVAMYLLRTETAASLPQIGEVLGGRDHSTILHGYSKIAHEMTENNQLRRDILAIREMLQPNPILATSVSSCALAAVPTSVPAE